MSNHRYSKFWWQDWHGDKALHACSIGARGFWMELLCIAHEGKPYGHVTINGEAATVKQMAASANCTEKDATKWLGELEASRVFSRTSDGVIWNRRMVKDMEAAETFKQIGKKGGNPALKRHDNGGDNGGGKRPDNRPDNGRGYPPPLTSITHSHKSESESARGTPLPYGGQGAPLSETVDRSNPRSNPETEAVILTMEARTGIAAIRPKPAHLTPEQLAVARARKVAP